MFVQKITAADPVWSTRPTWIVDTGDQTTFGDDASFHLARGYLSSFFSAVGATLNSGALVNLLGNHDAWPEDVPLLAGGKIPAHTAAIGGAPFHYAVGTAQSVLAAPLASSGEIQLFTIDTVNDGPWENFWARGHVEKVQLDDLFTLIQNQQQAAGVRNLRILATHHPIHFPPKRPRYEMVIGNEANVRRRLGAAAAPLVHLMLSGHNHKLYREHGDLPHSPRVCPQCTLIDDQCQLVVGSLMQVDRFGERGDHPHQCEVLRFYQDPASDVIVLHRLLAARNPYDDPPRIDYDFVLLGDDGQTAEEIVLTL